MLGEDARCALVTALSRLTGVQGVLCFGSYATGSCDERSDLDLFIACHPDLVPSEHRRQALETVEGVTEVRVDQRNAVWDNQWIRAEDALRLDGVPVEIAWNTLDWLRGVVAEVKEGRSSSFRLDSQAHLMLGLLADSVILFDPEGALQQMRSQLYPYPPRLKQVLLDRSFAILNESTAEMKDCVNRGIGNTAFHFHLERFLESLRALLFTVNERYDAGAKRVEEVYRTLPKLPHDFTARYQRLLETPLTVACREALVCDLDALCQECELLIRD